MIQFNIIRAGIACSFQIAAASCLMASSSGSKEKYPEETPLQPKRARRQYHFDPKWLKGFPGIRNSSHGESLT